MTTLPVKVEIEGRVVCDARAHLCHCVKDAGHVEAGDPVHGCNPAECRGQWTGEFDGPDFLPVVMAGPPS